MTQDEIIRMAREAGFINLALEPKLTRFAAIVAAHEREACAKVCDAYFEKRLGTADADFGFGAYDCAAAIRARGERRGSDE